MKKQLKVNIAIGQADLIGRAGLIRLWSKKFHSQILHQKKMTYLLL